MKKYGKKSHNFKSKISIQPIVSDEKIKEKLGKGENLVNNPIIVIKPQLNINNIKLKKQINQLLKLSNSINHNHQVKQKLQKILNNH